MKDMFKPDIVNNSGIPLPQALHKQLLNKGYTHPNCTFILFWGKDQKDGK